MQKCIFVSSNSDFALSKLCFDSTRVRDRTFQVTQNKETPRQHVSKIVKYRIKPVCILIWGEFSFVPQVLPLLRKTQAAPRDRRSSLGTFTGRGIIVRAVIHTNGTKETASFYGTFLCPNTGSLPAQVPPWLIYSQVSPLLRHGAVVWHTHTHTQHTVHTLHATEWKKLH